MIKIGSDPDQIKKVQTAAAKSMKGSGYKYPTKSCAATLSQFLRAAGIDVPVTRGAQNLADRLRINRKWSRVKVGKQVAGDVGVCRSVKNDVAGADHIYLVIDNKNDDLMNIVDNQAQGKTHPRYASGKGRTATEYFLRAQAGEMRLAELDAGELDENLVEDEDTNDLPEPFMDDGSPRIENEAGAVSFREESEAETEDSEVDVPLVEELESARDPRADPAYFSELMFASGDAVGPFDRLASHLMSDLIADFGLNRDQAAGIVGNVGAECGGFSVLQERHPIRPPGGYGWCQWTGPRRKQFFSFCHEKGLSVDSYDGNLAFLSHELNTSYKRVLSNIQKSRTLEDATSIFLMQFEKPLTPNLRTRVRYATRALRAYEASGS
ncbi:hypothetical protein FV232_05530 [Methylobacterium sp. WL30]|uniref:phage tail tip lysozyme n=1 Tax=unclassified Methylobacterium TaxID=2615210 RepID=UPI0011C9ECC5|nr:MULTISPECIES: phage tail tip lysozyme [unclassified Methylobacterium]TXN40614.1 hypothetical protein FV225_05635 [Methylobacterium sp. WL93]TXN51552.1 hypothetical protein FV227_07150 [Methylobacterium sp. WL119]TXN69534.1 hypothetical protein FV232_05530 [Methylobacterium sp. WL30]